MIGKDAERWQRDVPTYRVVRRENVYEGIDAVYYGARTSLEYDFVVAPGADPSQIRVRFEGQRAARVDEQGDLVLDVASGALKQRRPVVYQDGAAGKRAVSAEYVLGADGEVGIAVGEYDRTRPLVVDPVIEFSDYLGGTTTVDEGFAVAVDASGALYVAGETRSSDFPVTLGALDTSLGNLGSNAFVTKLAPGGTSVVYSTYFGSEGGANARGVAVDAAGAVYITGDASAYADDFPSTPGAYDTTPNGSVDAYVAKISPDGASLVYSTLLGGAGQDNGFALAVDASGAVYAAGSTQWATGQTPFPTTAGAYDTTSRQRNGYVAKLNPSGSALVYSTFTGGGFDVAALALGPGGKAVVTGGFSELTTVQFQTTPGAFDDSLNGFTDGYVLRLNAAGSAAEFATLFGGNWIDNMEAVAVDGTGAVYVAGMTESSFGFPITPGAYDTSYNGKDAFVAKLSPDGSTLVYGTYLGGSGVELSAEDWAYGLAVDATGAAYVVGGTYSSSFPTISGAFDTSHNGNRDVFVTKLAPDGGSLVYSGLYGGLNNETAYAVAVDASGAAYVAGTTGSADYPTVGSLAAAPKDGANALVAKVAPSGASLVYTTTIGGVVGLASSPADQGDDIAVDALGAVYVAGLTSAVNFPTTPGAFDSLSVNFDVFVSKISTDGATLVASTYLGGSNDDAGASIAVDGAGSVFVGGYTYSSDFPVTPGAFDTTYAGGTARIRDGFVVKLSPSLGTLAYGTYLGTSEDDVVNDVAVDATGAAYVTGTTNADDFPTTSGVILTTSPGGTDGFVTKLAPNGASLLYSTLIGGESSDFCNSIVVDAAGTVYVAGLTGSSDLPVTPGAYDTTPNSAFIMRINATGTSVLYGTYLGGSGSDTIHSLAVDGSGNMYVAGTTRSTNFPTTPGAPDPMLTGIEDAFVTKINATGSSLVFSTYLGGFDMEWPPAVCVGPGGRAFVTGTTNSLDFPTMPNGVRVTNDRTFDAYLCVFGSSGGFEYSTLFGGSSTDAGYAIACDTTGAAIFTGFTGSLEIVPTGFGYVDFMSTFVAKLRPPTPGTEAADTPGVYVASSGAWFLRNSSTPGGADVTFTFGGGGAGLVPIAGDWDGDGDDTPGLYATATGAFFLKNTSSSGVADVVFTFGAGGLVPLAGDWNGDGVDTIGLYDPATGAFFLRNSNAPGVADAVFTFGGGGAGITPVTGDWNGDGADTVGLYVASTGTFFLRNANAPGAADLAFSYGPASSSPILGDWNGDGIGTVGIYVPGTVAWFLRDTNSPGGANTVFSYGPSGVTPLAGDWDGQ